MEKDQLKELESLGELQFTIKECGIILTIDPDDLAKMISEDKDVSNAYQRGRLRASAEVRKSILQQAKQGSSPAQKQMLELIEQNTKAFHKVYGY